MSWLIHEVQSEGWAVAQSPILVTTITLERLRKRGLSVKINYYEKIAQNIKDKESLREYCKG